MPASDKLFFWLFQSQPDRILQLLEDLPADAGGYRFVAPVFKALEHRPDGLFLAPAERPDLPALILEAQMAADPDFLLRLYAESARFLLQDKTIRHWLVVVICPSRQLAFGDPEPVREFLERRVRWLELQPALADPGAPANPGPAAGKRGAAAHHHGGDPSPGGRHSVGGSDRRCHRRYPVGTLHDTSHPGDLRYGRHHPGRLHPERGLPGDLWAWGGARA